jgi:hypothetical protein
MVILILIVAGALGFLLVFSQQQEKSPQAAQGQGAAGYGSAASGGGNVAPPSGADGK